MSETLLEKIHMFHSPNKVIFGLGSAKTVGEESRRLGGKTALIVTDPGVVRADLTGPVLTSLKASGISYSIFDQVEPEPPARLVDQATRQYREDRCDFIVGIGGGSSLDVAKGVSVAATNKGDILALCGIDQVKKKGVPKILLPTTSGTGSEVTRVLVITDEKENMKKVVFSTHVLADVAIVDPLLSLSLPPKVTAESGVDALVHAIETYVSMNATPFSDILAEKAIRLITRYLPQAWAKGSNLDARYFMSLAATTAGMAFASGGLGAVHALAYPLGTEYHMSHGRSNAVMLPHVMAFNLPGSPVKYTAIAALMGQDTEDLTDTEAACLAVDAVIDLLESIQIPFHLKDYGISKEDLEKLVAGGMQQARLFEPNPRDLSEEDVRAVYEDAY